MPLKAKILIAVIVAAGVPPMVWGLLNWDSTDPVRCLAYLVMAVLTAGMKVTLPGFEGTMSVSFFWTFIGLVELSLPETLLIGGVSSLVQTFWHSKTRAQSLVRLAFNLSVVSMAITDAYEVFRWAAPWPVLSNTLLRLGLVAVVYFAANTLPVAAVIALSQRKPVSRFWRECHLWCFPFYVVGACTAGLAAGINSILGWEATILAVPVVVLIQRYYKVYLEKLQLEKKQVSDMAALHLRTIEALALAIDAKDDNTADHLRRVQVYAIEIGKELGVAGEDMEALRAAALLHDIGKLAVPEHILCKPGKLTAQEFEKVKIHPIVAAEILEQVDFPYPVVPIVRAHHEKWDGTGYPEQLKGEQIPMGARILAVVDAFDAMVTERPYRAAFPVDVALRTLQELSGKNFDPKVVEVLVRRIEELEEITRRSPSQLKRSTRAIRTRASSDSNRVEVPAAIRNEGFVSTIAAARQEVQVLLEVTQDLGTSLSLTETLSVMATRIKRLVDYDAVAIYILKDKSLVPEYVNGQDYGWLSELRIPFGEGLTGWVAANRRPILNGNPCVEAAHLEDSRSFTLLRSALAIPLSDQNGIVGVLTLYGMMKDAFDEDCLRVLSAVSGKLGMAVGNSLRFEQAENTAVTDQLTGLPNARSLTVHLNEELAAAKAAGHSLAVIVSDLDGFKSLNDRFGHLAGNRALQEVAKGFRAALRGSDFVARMGGDEFVFVLRGVDTDTLARLNQRLQQAAIDAGRVVCGEDLLSASLGFALYPDQGIDSQQLLDEADRRMYAVKAESKKRRIQTSSREPNQMFVN